MKRISSALPKILLKPTHFLLKATSPKSGAYAQFVLSLEYRVEVEGIGLIQVAADAINRAHKESLASKIFLESLEAYYDLYEKYEEESGDSSEDYYEDEDNYVPEDEDYDVPSYIKAQTKYEKLFSKEIAWMMRRLLSSGSEFLRKGSLEVERYYVWAQENHPGFRNLSDIAEFAEAARFFHRSLLKEKEESKVATLKRGYMRLESLDWQGVRNRHQDRHVTVHVDQETHCIAFQEFSALDLVDYVISQLEGTGEMSEAIRSGFKTLSSKYAVDSYLEETLSNGGEHESWLAKVPPIQIEPIFIVHGIWLDPLEVILPRELISEEFGEKCREMAARVYARSLVLLTNTNSSKAGEVVVEETSETTNKDERKEVKPLTVEVANVLLKTWDTLEERRQKYTHLPRRVDVCISGRVVNVFFPSVLGWLEAIYPLEVVERLGYFIGSSIGPILVDLNPGDYKFFFTAHKRDGRESVLLGIVSGKKRFVIKHEDGESGLMVNVSESLRAEFEIDFDEYESS